MFKLDPERINWDEKLGSGSFGAVYPYQKNPNDKKWAVKNLSTKEPEKLLMYFQEIVLGFSCDNPYVLPIKGFCIENKNRDWDIYMKMPRMKTSLKAVIADYKNSNNRIPEEKIAQYFYDIIQGLQYLHEKGIAHRDIKPDNILISEQDEVKISDFGLGNFYLEGTLSTFSAEKAGHVFYAAPENRDSKIQLKTKELFKADLWSLGMVLFELCSLVDLRTVDLYSSWEKVEASLLDKLRELKGLYSETLLVLIASLLRYKPSERQSLKKIQEELIAYYGNQLKMGKYDKGAQTEKFEFAEKRKLEELENLIKLKDLDFIEMQRNYEKTIIDLDMKVKSVQEKLEMRSAEKLDKIDKKIEGIDVQADKKPLEEGIVTQALERNWKNYFYINADQAGKKLSIFTDSKKIDENTIELLMRNLKEALRQNNCEDIESFSFCTSESEQSQGITDRGIQELAAQIGQNFKSLKYLGLDFSMPSIETAEGEHQAPSEISDQSLQELAVQIGQNLKNLHHLEILCGNSPNVSDKGMQDLLTQIGQNHQTIQYLGLGFNRSIITDKTLLGLAALVKGNLKDLEDLSLHFNNCTKITDKGLLELIMQAKQNLTKLDSLDLNFDNSSCSKHLVQFAECLKNFRRLDFMAGGLSSDIPQKVAVCILAIIKDLQHLGLFLDEDTAFSAETLKKLTAFSGKYLNNLQVLNIQFEEGSEYVARLVLDELIGQFERNLKNLKHLRIFFHMSWTEDSFYYYPFQEIDALSVYIGEYLSNLEQLELKYRFISKEGLNNLSIQLGKKFKNLRHLHLDFTGCEKVSDSNLQWLAGQIAKNIKNLDHLHLNFSRCVEISDNGIQGLAAQVGQNLINLKHLHLDFSQCMRISDNGLRELAIHTAENLKDLKEVYLHFGQTGCTKIGEELIHTAFGFVPTRTIKVIPPH